MNQEDMSLGDLVFSAGQSASADLDAVSYPQELLEEARSHICNRKFSVAVVVAHMACEIATERCLSSAFNAPALQHLKEPIFEFLNGYSLKNEKNRKLYTALTGNKIQDQPFWEAFKKSATRRNGIIHEGIRVQESEAKDSYKAAKDFVDYLKQ